MKAMKVPYAQLEAGRFTHLVYRYNRIDAHQRDAVLYSATLTWDVEHREPVLMGQFFSVRANEPTSGRGLDLHSMSACTALFDEDLHLFRRRRGPIYPPIPPAGLVRERRA